MKSNAKNGLLSDYFRLQGKKGGKSKSKAKLAAMARNLEKARASRWLKKEGVTIGKGKERRCPFDLGLP